MYIIILSNIHNFNSIVKATTKNYQQLAASITKLFLRHLFTEHFITIYTRAKYILRSDFSVFNEYNFLTKCQTAYKLHDNLRHELSDKNDAENDVRYIIS